MIPDWPAERWQMVETQLRRRGIRDERVLAAMGEIPREEFVPLDLRVLAYRDEPVPIGFGQTSSQPYMTALMAQELCLSGSEKVLEVGAGCGYAAAVMALLVARVVTVEIVPQLVTFARTNLARTGRDSNIEVVDGDGSWGHLSQAPYDGISVAAAAPDIPTALIEQLADHGRVVIPVGSLADQELRVLTKRGSSIASRVATTCRFVPLRGGEGWR